MMKNALKIVVKGDKGVGKTTIAAQFAEKVFDLIDFNTQPDYTKNIIVEDMTRRIELLDVPEDFQMGDYFTEYGQGFLLVYSIADYQTFTNAKTMRENILKIKKSNHVPIVLVGNKRDVEARAVQHEEAAALAASWPNCRFTEISAKYYDEVEQAFTLLVKEILSLEQGKGNQRKKKRKCFCCMGSKS